MEVVGYIPLGKPKVQWNDFLPWVGFSLGISQTAFYQQGYYLGV